MRLLMLIICSLLASLRIFARERSRACAMRPSIGSFTGLRCLARKTFWARHITTDLVAPVKGGARGSPALHERHVLHGKVKPGLLLAMEHDSESIARAWLVCGCFAARKTFGHLEDAPRSTEVRRKIIFKQDSAQTLAEEASNAMGMEQAAIFFSLSHLIICTILLIIQWVSWSVLPCFVYSHVYNEKSCNFLQGLLSFVSQ